MVASETSPEQGTPPGLAGHPDAEGLLVRKLVEAGLVTAEDGYAVAADLVMGTEVGQERPLSALHALRERGIRNLVDIALFLSKDSGVPMLPLAQFTPQHACFASLDKSLADCAGALAFDSLGDALLVAVLNPYDEDLQRRVAACAGRPCVFYLVLPSHYDEALAAMKSLN